MRGQSPWESTTDPQSLVVESILMKSKAEWGSPLPIPEAMNAVTGSSLKFAHDIVSCVMQ